MPKLKQKSLINTRKINYNQIDLQLQYKLNKNRKFAMFNN